MEHAWNPITVDEAVRKFAPVEIEWWVAGGVAIDLFLGWESRSHSDLDLEILRKDCAALFDVFDGWQLFAVSEQSLDRWLPGKPLEQGVFAVWGRPSADDPWSVEVMLADGDSSTWRFRGDNTISLSLAALVRLNPGGVPYSTPEVQLLYKAYQKRQKDDIDLARTLHLMAATQKTWLCDAIRKWEPDHPWVVVLDPST